VTGTGGTGTLRYKFDAGSWITTMSLVVTPSVNLTDGSHTLYVQESDNANNWSESGTASIDIDTASPQIPTVALPYQRLLS
jgi:hypothetical protein